MIEDIKEFMYNFKHEHDANILGLVVLYDKPAPNLPQGASSVRGTVMLHDCPHDKADCGCSVLDQLSAGAHAMTEHSWKTYAQKMGLEAAEEMREFLHIHYFS